MGMYVCIYIYIYINRCHLWVEGVQLVTKFNFCFVLVLSQNEVIIDNSF